jgi:hypothetical protein
MRNVEAHLSAWENEGGALAPDGADNHRREFEPSPEEQQILEQLGIGVVAEWKNLPTEIQRRLFNRATSATASRNPRHAREQIARFLHGIIKECEYAGHSTLA